MPLTVCLKTWKRYYYIKPRVTRAYLHKGTPQSRSVVFILCLVLIVFETLQRMLHTPAADTTRRNVDNLRGTPIVTEWRYGFCGTSILSSHLKKINLNRDLFASFVHMCGFNVAVNQFEQVSPINWFQGVWINNMQPPVFTAVKLYIMFFPCTFIIILFESLVFVYFDIFESNWADRAPVFSCLFDCVYRQTLSIYNLSSSQRRAKSICLIFPLIRPFFLRPWFRVYSWNV